jgi:hypothetical protein
MSSSVSPTLKTRETGLGPGNTAFKEEAGNLRVPPPNEEAGFGTADPPESYQHLSSIDVCCGNDAQVEFIVAGNLRLPPPTSWTFVLIGRQVF